MRPDRRIALHWLTLASGQGAWLGPCPIAQLGERIVLLRAGKVRTMRVGELLERIARTHNGDPQ